MKTFPINTMRALLCVLVLLPFASGADTLYRCKAANAPVAYQDAPCASNAKTLSTQEYVPEPASTPQTPSRMRKAERTLGRVASQRRTSTRARNTPMAARDTRESCSEAKQQRDEWERHTGLKRRYDDLRTWNDRVWRACS